MHFLKKIIYLLCIYLSLFYVREISSGLHAIHPPPPHQLTHTLAHFLEPYSLIKSSLLHFVIKILFFFSVF